MLVILDLDYTLLDTTAFKRALESSLASEGVSEEQFWETFGMIAGLSDAEGYSIERHARVLHDQFGVPEDIAAANLHAVFEALPGMLYQDSLPFLTFLREHGISAVLLTFGNEAFQEAKVRASGIPGMFMKTIYTEESKDVIDLALPFLESEWVFINDNPRELRELAARYPEAQMIRITRPDGKKFSPEDDVLDVPTFESFEGVKQQLGL